MYTTVGAGVQTSLMQTFNVVWEQDYVHTYCLQLYTICLL